MKVELRSTASAGRFRSGRWQHKACQSLSETKAPARHLRHCQRLCRDNDSYYIKRSISYAMQQWQFYKTQPSKRDIEPELHQHQLRLQHRPYQNQEPPILSNVDSEHRSQPFQSHGNCYRNAPLCRSCRLHTVDRHPERSSRQHRACSSKHRAAGSEQRRA